jgi:DNA-binding MarR family transcriptional regulator
MKTEKAKKQVISPENLDKISGVIRETYGEETKVVISLGKSKVNIEQFGMLFLVAAGLVSDKLSPISCKLILKLFSKMQYGEKQNYGCAVNISVETLAKELEVSQNTIYTAITELKKEQVINVSKSEFDKRNNIYFLHPRLIYKGKPYVRQVQIKVHEKEHLKAIGQRQMNLWDSLTTEHSLLPISKKT